MDFELYPLLFEPILKDKIWGGTKLKDYLQKQIVSETTGESWEISGVTGDISIIKQGTYKGKSLTWLLEHFPEQVSGKKIHKQFGTDFPLLFKFLDAKDDLSIQVHPNDELAKKRHNSFGKTEMWYVMQADEGAEIIVGFKENSSPEEYLTHLENNSLPEILNSIKVKKGDVFLLETGTIHAIRGGIVIAEIQQTSDITYRVYDWNRKDENGKPRELHIDEALEAINYKAANTQKLYSKEINKSNPIVYCPYFTTNFLPLNGTVTMAKNDGCFTVYICTEGSFTISSNNKNYNFTKGDTVLLPAALNNFILQGEATLLEIYIS